MHIKSISNTTPCLSGHFDDFERAEPSAVVPEDRKGRETSLEIAQSTKKFPMFTILREYFRLEKERTESSTELNTKPTESMWR